MTNEPNHEKDVKT